MCHYQSGFLYGSSSDNSWKRKGRVWATGSHLKASPKAPSGLHFVPTLTFPAPQGGTASHPAAFATPGVSPRHSAPRSPGPLPTDPTTFTPPALIGSLLPRPLLLSLCPLLLGDILHSCDPIDC